MNGKKRGSPVLGSETSGKVFDCLPIPTFGTYPFLDIQWTVTPLEGSYTVTYSREITIVTQSLLIYHYLTNQSQNLDIP